MRRLSPPALALIAGLVVVFAVALVAGFGDDPAGLVERRAGAGTSSAWSQLGIGALVGALTGAIGTHALHSWGERIRHMRERDGLALLVWGEIIRNQAACQLFKTNPNFIAEGAFSDVTMETWEQVRVRLVQLIYPPDFADVQYYYMALESHVVFLERYRAAFGTDEEARWEQTVRDHLEIVEPEEEKAREALHKYIHNRYVPPYDRYVPPHG